MYNMYSDIQKKASTISLLCDAAVQVEWRRPNKQLGDGYRDGGSARTFDATCSCSFLLVLYLS